MNQRGGTDGRGRTRRSTKSSPATFDEGPVGSTMRDAQNRDRRRAAWRTLAAALAVGACAMVVVAGSGKPLSVVSIGAAPAASSTVPTTIDPPATSTTTTNVATSPTTTLPTTPTTAEVDVPIPPPSTVPDPAVSDAAAAKRFCSLSSAYAGQVRMMEMSLTDPVRLRELLDAAAPAIAESATIASAQVKGDVAALATAISAIRAALETADYELAKLPPDMVMHLHSPPVQDALNGIEIFTGEAC